MAYRGAQRRRRSSSTGGGGQERRNLVGVGDERRYLIRVRDKRRNVAQVLGTSKGDEQRSSEHEERAHACSGDDGGGRAGRGPRGRVPGSSPLSIAHEPRRSPTGN